MATAHHSEKADVTPFVFTSLDRANNAAKRLKAALRIEGKLDRPLGWYKTILSRMVGYGGWEELRRAIDAKQEPSRLDHDLKDFAAVCRRRREQARTLANEADIIQSTAGWIIDEVEPTGNGTGPFRLFDVDEEGEVTLRYLPPPIPAQPDGRLRLFSEDRQDLVNPYGAVDLLYDTLADRVGYEVVDAMTLECLGDDRWRIGIVEPVASTTFRRSLTADLYKNEPRPLRPTEIRSARMEWSVENCEFPNDEYRDETLEAIGTAIAALMIRDAIWALIEPRPPIIERFLSFLDINEDVEDQVLLSERVADMHGYALDTDEEFATDEDDGAILGREMRPFRIVGLCQEIARLEVTDN